MRIDEWTDRYDKANTRLPRIIQTPLVRLNYIRAHLFHFSHVVGHTPRHGIA